MDCTAVHDTRKMKGLLLPLAISCAEVDPLLYAVHCLVGSVMAMTGTCDR